MAKKKGKTAIQIQYFIDNEPSSLMEIVENNPDDTIWKEYLEKNNLQGSYSAERYLEGKIGDYLSAQEISKRTDIKVRILDKWRGKGYLKAEQLKGRWYYSLSSVIQAINSVDVNDIR
jgi:Mor family transcriptional regulator